MAVRLFGTWRAKADSALFLLAMVSALACSGCGGDRSGPEEAVAQPAAAEAEPQAQTAAAVPIPAAPVSEQAGLAVSPSPSQPPQADEQPPILRAEAVPEQGPSAEEQPASPPAPQDVDFQLLPTAEPVTSMALTEDRQFLVLTHQAANLVSVFDVASLQQVATLETPSPRSVLCRGEGVYVANFGEGTISFFSRANGWELADQFDVDKPNIVHLSAPRGEYFQGELLVMCHPDGPTGSYQGCQVFHVDTKTDRARAISADALASVSADGKLVYAQGSFNLSPSGGISAHSYPDYVSGKSQRLFAGGVPQTPYVYQVHTGSFWFGDHMVFGGAPIQLLQKDLGNIIVPDIAQRIFYALTKERLRAHRMDTSLSEIGYRKVAWPQRQADKFEGIYHALYRHRGYLLDHPVAVTRGNELRLFVIDMSQNTVLTARTAAFEFAGLASPQVAAAGPSTSDAMPGAAALVESALGLPARALEGETIRVQLKAPPGTQFELMGGPQGMTLSESGLLAWTPSKPDVGTHELKIRVKSGSKVSFERPSVEVVDQALVAGRGGSLENVDQFERLELTPDHYELSPGLAYKSLLLLQADQLRALGSDGFSVTADHKLPQRYRQIAERDEYYVALSKEPAQLDLIDKRTLKVRKSLPVQRTGVRVLDVMDLAIHPKQPLTFVSIKHDIDLPRYRILIVDEKSGNVDAPEDLIGTWIEVDPAGRYLYAGYEDLYERGYRFHINPGWQLIQSPEYGSIDWLLTYSLRGRTPAFRQIVTEAGGNGYGIVLSPDGQRITYLSHVGTPRHAKNLVAWNPTNLKQEPVNYGTKDRAVTTLLAFHPTLKLVAVPGGKSAVLFDRESGRLLENKLQLTATGLGDATVEQLLFSPDGKSLIFVCNDVTTGRYLRRVRLTLTPAEAAEAGKDVSEPPAAPAASQNLIAVSRTQLEALKPAGRTPTMSAKEISRRFMDSVVVVESEDGWGTGFLVGRRGYILTCAHALPVDGEIKVSYSATIRGKLQTITTRAELVRVDEDRDLALLKIGLVTRLEPVMLAATDGTEAGEQVAVIGNPGLGTEILSHTLTTGVVSSPRREIDGRAYVQTSATVNSGNSGGPMFDSRGQVIGLVVLKADIDGTAFAIPSGDLREFLEAATKQED